MKRSFKRKPISRRFKEKAKEDALIINEEIEVEIDGKTIILEKGDKIVSGKKRVKEAYYSSVEDAAKDYVDDKIASSELPIEDFLRDMERSFDKCPSISDCFTDTSYWADGESFSVDELEYAIVDYISFLNNKYN